MTTNLERAWMDAITQLGCIVCFVFENAPGTPGCPHHLLTDGGRRIGHLDTICLCDPGHHQNTRRREGQPASEQGALRAGLRQRGVAARATRKLVEARFGLFIGLDIDAIHHKLGSVRNV
jgi:hypothetical protein